MADNKLELVVEVDANRANASIKRVNASLSSMEAAAAKSARGAAQGIDSMTAAMVKGATAGNLLADAIKSALAWAKDFTVGSVMMAAENAKAEASQFLAPEGVLWLTTSSNSSSKSTPTGPMRPSRASTAVCRAWSPRL